MGDDRKRVVVLSGNPGVVHITAAALLRSGHEPVAAIVPRWRDAADDLSVFRAGLPVPTTEVILAPERSELEPLLRSLQPDLMLSWEFPWLIPTGALGAPAYGSINYHPSLLPRHRGPSPVAWSIRMGDDRYGATWHRMDGQFDHGPTLAQRATPADPGDTASDIGRRLTTMGLRMLPSVIERVVARDPGDPQPGHGATEEGPFGEDYATIDWSMPARAIHDQVRAWAFIPPSHPVVGPIGELDGQRVRLAATTLRQPDDEGGARRVECGDGPLWVLETEPVIVQPSLDT
jgi:methionyl-tRNA formyltransferase